MSVALPNPNRGRGRPVRSRHIDVVPVRREQIDVRKLARALLVMIQHERDVTASKEVEDGRA